MAHEPALWRRMESLPADQWHLLLRPGTLGRPMALEGLSAEVLTALEHRGLIRREHGQVGLLHDEIAAAALALASSAERREAHREVRRALARLTDRGLRSTIVPHAERGEDNALLRRVVEDELRARRQGGDRRHTWEILRKWLGTTVAEARQQQLLATMSRTLRWRRGG